MAKKNHTSYFKKFLSLSLSFVMLFTNIFSQYTFVFAEDDDQIVTQSTNGFNFSLEWNTGDNPTNLEWNATTSDKKVIRLNVGYENSSVEGGYEPGELQITVPGIGGANRSGIVEAADVAADKADSETKERDWSYTYNKDTDTYTFKNNNAIEEKSNFSGSFEILWHYSPRDIINGYEKNIKATLSSPGETLESNEISFKFTSERDAYSISETHAGLSSKDGLGSDYKDFYWVNWTISSGLGTKARGTVADTMFYMIDTPEGAIVKFAYTKDGSKVNVSKSENGYRIPYTKTPITVTMAYPVETYSDATVENPVSLFAKYEDETEVVNVANTTDSVYLNDLDYGFKYGSDGPIGVGIEKSISSSSNKILYSEAVNGTANRRFYLEPDLSIFDGLYDLVIWDDILDIKLLDGSFRRLKDNEYAMVAGVIPAANDILIGNNQKLEADKYECEVYTRISGNAEYTLFDTKVISTTSQTVELPENTVGIKFKVKNVDTSFATDKFAVDFKFTIDSSDATINKNGFIRNLDAIEVFQDDVCLNIVGEENYTGDLKTEIAARDMELYGKYMQRALADLALQEENIDLVVATSIKSNDFTSGDKVFNSSLNITTSFENEFKNKAAVTEFSQYTILPKGLEIDIDNVKFDFTPTNIVFANDVKPSVSYIESHANIDIIENYRSTGETYIKIDYDFTDRPVYMYNSSLVVAFDVFVTDESYLEFGEVYDTKAVTMIHQEDNYFLYKNLSAIDDGSYFNSNVDLWKDLDNDGKTDEDVSYSIDSQAIILALSSYQEIQKSVKSDYTKNKYVMEDAVTLLNKQYSYKLKFRTGNSSAKNVVFYDILETADGTEWQGSFVDVDTSYLVEKGYKPTVYYSSLEEPGDLSNTNNWSTTQTADVKSIAVALGDSIVSKNSLLYVLVNLKTPNDETLINKKAINDFNVSFISLDMTGLETTQTSLESNLVDIGLSEPIGDVSVIKKDAISGNKLSGAEFNLYNGHFKQKYLEFEELNQANGYVNTGFSYIDGVYKSNNTIEDEYSEMISRLFTVEDSATLSFEYAIGSETSEFGYQLFSQEDGWLDDSFNSNYGEVTVSNESELTYETVTIELASGSYALYLGHYIEEFIDGGLNTAYVKNVKLTTNGNTTLIPVYKSGSNYNLTFKNDNGIYVAENSEQHLEYDTWSKSTTNYFEIEESSVISIEYAISGYYSEFYFDVYDYETDDWVDGIEYCHEDGTGVYDESEMKFNFKEIELEPGTYYAEIYYGLYGLSDYYDGCHFKNLKVIEGDVPELIKTFKTNSTGVANIQNLDFGDYCLVETKAPKGYKLNSEPINITIDDLQKEIVVTNDRLDGKVQLHKTSSDNNSLNVKGATYDLYMENDDGDVLIKKDLVTDNLGKTAITEKLKWGTYYYIETKAANGFELNNNKVRFEIGKNAVNETYIVETTDQPKPAIVVLTKEEILEDGTTKSGNKVSNAVFDLYNSNDEIIKESLTTDTNGKIKVEALPFGDYYFKEKSAKGYIVNSNKLNFSLNPNNTSSKIKLNYNDEEYPWIESDGLWISGNSGIHESTSTITSESFTITETETLFFDWAVSSEYGYYDSFYYTIIKDGDVLDGTGTNTAICGNNEVSNISELSFEKVEIELEPGTYTIAFTYSKDDIYSEGLDAGYVKNLSIGKSLPYNLSFNENGNLECNIETSNVRKAGTVTLVKTDEESSEPIANAVFSLYDSDGTLIRDDLVSNTEGLIIISDLIWGDYYVVETTAPDGYQLDETHHEFSVNRDTVETTIVLMKSNARLKGKVQLTKVDESDENVVLQGAVYSLYDTNDNLIKDDLATDENGTILVEDLVWGSYYFLEKQAPTNYSMSDEKLRFSINASNVELVQNIVAKDSMVANGTIKITKQIPAADIWEAHGSSTFLFKIKGTDILGNMQILYRKIEIDEEYAKTNSINGIVEKNVYLTDLPVGTYIVSEVSTSRFELGEINDVINGQIVDNTVIFSLSDANLNSEVTFVNKKDEWEGYSHNDNVTNLVKVGSVPTAMKVEQLTDSFTFDNYGKDIFAVTIFYDDGSTRVLENSEYTMTPEIIEKTGDYTITFTYSLNGRTIKDYIDISFNGSRPFTANVYSVNNELIGTYDQTNGLVLTVEETPSYMNITGYSGPKSSSIPIVFPAKIEGIKVKSIGDGKVLSGLNSGQLTIIFSEGIEAIGVKAFYNLGNRLYCDIIIPDSITSIGDHAFYKNTSIKSLTLGKNLETIGQNAFYDCDGLTGDLIIPNNVTSIGFRAFRGCNGFDGTLTLSENLTTIGGEAFYSCSGLTGDLVIPNSVTTVEKSAFHLCGFDGTLTLSENLETISQYAFSCNFTGSLVIPNNVTTIETGAFSGCKFTGSLVIPNNVTTIGSSAFQSCAGFTGDLIIPNNVTTIGAGAFKGCTGFDGTLTLSENLETIDNNVFQSCAGFTGDLIIPNNVTTIGAGAFKGCTGFDGTLTLSQNLETIDNNAFYGCSGLTGDLIIPNNVITINYDAFYNCTGFDGTLTLSENLTTIGGEAFYGCSGLTGDLIIPNNVITINYDAFYNCTGFDGTLTLSENLETIGEYTFSGCSSLTGEVIIPSSVTNISNYAFRYVTSISNITIYNQLTTIGNNFSPTTVTIKGWRGSTAETYANSNGNTFVPLDNSFVLRNININDSNNGNNVSVVSQSYPNKIVTIESSIVNCDITSFKVNGKYYEGNKFVMPDADVVITDIQMVEYVLIESDHNPYANNLNYTVLGTWNYSDATSVNITITYQTQGTGYDWCSITSGTDYVAGSSYSSTRTYLDTSGSLVRTTGTNSSIKYGGSSKNTKTFENINLPTGSVIFKTNGSTNSYYGVTVKVVPNYD